jgi:hypothetical protein
LVDFKPIELVINYLQKNGFFHPTMNRPVTKKTTLPGSPGIQNTKKRTETSSPKISKPVKTKKAQPPKFAETKLNRSDSFANVLKRKGSSFFGALPELTGRASLGILSPKRKEAQTPFASPRKNQQDFVSPTKKDKLNLIAKLSSFKKGKENSTSNEKIEKKEESEDEDFQSPVKTLKFSSPKPKGIPTLNLFKIESVAEEEEEELEDDFEDEESAIVSIDSPKHDVLTASDKSLKSQPTVESVASEEGDTTARDAFREKISNSFKYDDDSGEEDEIDDDLIDQYGFDVPKNFIVKKRKEVEVSKKQSLLGKLMSPRGKNQ